MYYRRCRCNRDDDGMGCLIMLMVGLFAMPQIGLYMLIKGDEDSQAVGLILLIIGIIIWIAAACAG